MQLYFNHRYATTMNKSLHSIYMTHEEMLKKLKIEPSHLIGGVIDLYKYYAI